MGKQSIGPINVHAEVQRNSTVHTTMNVVTSRDLFGVSVQKMYMQKCNETQQFTQQ